jgi:hypothetical protein
MLKDDILNRVFTTLMENGAKRPFVNILKTFIKEN